MKICVFCSISKYWGHYYILQDIFLRGTKRLFRGLNSNLRTSASKMQINRDAATSLQRRIKDNTGRERAAGPP